MGSVKSARRVLEILEFFADRRDGATAHEIRSSLGYPQSSTSVLLHSLVSLGYLSHDGRSQVFRPTLRVALLGDWIVERLGQAASPPAVMRRLQAATGQTVVLGAQRGTDLIYLHVVQATDPVRVVMKAGVRRPLCHTAVGQALLSLRPEREVRLLVRRINAERADGTEGVAVQPLIDALGRGRRLGYFCTLGTATPGAGVVAVPVPGMEESGPLAMGIGAPIARIERELDGYVALLRKACSAKAVEA